jgi:hypothetical protein
MTEVPEKRFRSFELRLRAVRPHRAWASRAAPQSPRRGARRAPSGDKIALALATGIQAKRWADLHRALQALVDGHAGITNPQPGAPKPHDRELCGQVIGRASAGTLRLCRKTRARREATATRHRGSAAQDWRSGGNCLGDALSSASYCSCGAVDAKGGKRTFCGAA